MPGTLTLMLPTAPTPGAATLVGLTVVVHALPAWATTKLCPLTLINALRETVAVLAAAVNVTAPLPLPVAEPSVIQSAVVVAVQVHPAEATLKDPLPPA